MKGILVILFFSIYFFSINCTKEDTADPDNNNNANNNDSIIVTYEVTFNINWNSQDFPNNYPNGAHFSPLIGWSHKPISTFFKVGTISSSGIESMAEVGGTSTLSSEMEIKIGKGEGLKYVVGKGLGSGVGSIKVSIGVNKTYPAVTFSSMIAPSPDWYIAVVNVNLLEDNEFVSEKTVNALAYDAGTDEGANFTSVNLNSNPKKPISLIKNPPLGNGTTVSPSLATVTFVKK